MKEKCKAWIDHVMLPEELSRLRSEKVSSSNRSKMTTDSTIPQLSCELVVLVDRCTQLQSQDSNRGPIRGLDGSLRSPGIFRR